MTSDYPCKLVFFFKIAKLSRNEDNCYCASMQTEVKSQQQILSVAITLSYFNPGSNMNFSALQH